MIARALLLLVFACFFSPISSAAGMYGPHILHAPIAIDGDTVRGEVDIWPGLSVDGAFRVAGVDTPEIEQARCSAEKSKGISAKAFTDAWLSTQQPVSVGAIRPDKYSGRYDAVLTGRDGSVLAAELIKSGHGRPYSGGARRSWCD